MSSSRNRRTVPTNQPYGSSQNESLVQGGTHTQLPTSQDGATQGAMSRSSSYGYDDDLQRMKDVNSYHGVDRRKIVTNDADNFHLSKPYEWHYTSTSGAKSLQSIEDACKYVKMMGNSWKVSHLPRGVEFLETLIDAIQRGEPEFTTEHSMTNELGETTYVMVVARATNFQQREVLHSCQQLSKSSMPGTMLGGTPVSQYQPLQWFQRKAVETLSIHTNVIRSFNTSMYHENLSGCQQATSKKPICKNFSLDFFFPIELILC